MKSEKPYTDLSDFFRKFFPYKVQKIPVNAGFTCPNRDGSKGHGGCSYCNNLTFSPDYCNKKYSIREQIKSGIDFFSAKYPNMRYLAYFQSYTNTYGDTADLMRLYQEALAYPEVCGLIISTRPDCIKDDLLSALSELKKDYFVLIEFGVESTLNRTLRHINRGHLFEDSEDAIRRTADHGIFAGAHLILGLPGESREEMLHHAIRLSALPVTTLKLHHLQIIKGTNMAKEFALNPEMFHLFSLDEYAHLCVEFTERLRKGIVIERFASQSPKDLLIAPDWGIRNNEFTVRVLRLFDVLHTWQGKYYDAPASNF